MCDIVILTGFAGFIGNKILWDLIQRGYYVLGIDNLSIGSDVSNFNNISYENFYPIFADISDPNLSKYLSALYSFKGKEVGIINCAAQSHVDRSWNQVDDFIKSNINGPINLAKIAIDLKVKKFVHVSTDEVHGRSLQPFTEETPLNTGNAYASSKAAAELFLKNYYEGFGLPLVITRGANTYGPRQKEKIIPLTIEKLIKGEKVPLYKTRARRLYLHVSDHSNGIISALEKGKIGETYCLAPEIENELYTSDLVKMICDIMKKDFNECVELVQDRPSYDLRYWMKNDKAKKELNWFPQKDIRKELESVVNWYVTKFGLPK